jgi:hypothetical protein
MGEGDGESDFFAPMIEGMITPVGDNVEVVIGALFSRQRGRAEEKCGQDS